MNVPRRNGDAARRCWAAHLRAAGHGLLASTLLLATSQAVAQAPGQAAVEQKQSASPPDAAFGVEDGTPIQLALCGEVSSLHAHQGDVVDFQVTSAVTVQGIAVLPAHSHAWGTVSKAHAGRGMASRGGLNISIDAVRAAGGEEVSLRAVKDERATKDVSTGALVVGSGALLFVTAGLALPFLLFSRGKEVKLTDGWEVTAFVNGRAMLDQEKSTREAAARAKLDSGANTESGQPRAKLRIEANYPCAEIEIDGHFIALTPYEVLVPPGEHSVAVRKRGFKPYELHLDAPPGGLKVKAQLKPEEKSARSGS